jgi:hypothetical protein
MRSCAEEFGFSRQKNVGCDCIMENKEGADGKVYSFCAAAGQKNDFDPGRSCLFLFPLFQFDHRSPVEFTTKPRF